MTAGWRHALVPTLAMLAALAALLALGAWQLQRKGEKEALIAAVNARAFGQAAALPPATAWPGLDADRIAYQRVRLDGRFRSGPEAYVFGILPELRNRPAQPGYWVHAPFDLATGGTVLVNRGFVPFERRDPATRPGSQAPEGPATLEGLVRAPEARSLLAPADDPARATFFTRDPAAMARAAGLGPVAPFTVDQATANPGPLPIPGETRVTFPNRHLEYALTWFGLAAGLVGVWAVFVFGRRRREAELRPAHGRAG